MNITNHRWLFAVLIFGLTFGLSSCGSLGGSSSSETASNEEETIQNEPEESSEEMETPQLAIPEDSLLAKVEMDMSDTRVRNLIGNPSDARHYQTGKAWIPFYYGPDTHRTEWVYPGEGRVVFSRNRYSGTLKVINVLYNPDQI